MESGLQRDPTGLNGGINDGEAFNDDPIDNVDPNGTNAISSAASWLWNKAVTVADTTAAAIGRTRYYGPRIIMGTGVTLLNAPINQAVNSATCESGPATLATMYVSGDVPIEGVARMPAWRNAGINAHSVHRDRGHARARELGSRRRSGFYRASGWRVSRGGGRPWSGQVGIWQVPDPATNAGYNGRLFGRSVGGA